MQRRAGWISMLLLESLRDAVEPPGPRLLQRGAAAVRGPTGSWAVNVGDWARFCKLLNMALNTLLWSVLCHVLAATPPYNPSKSPTTSPNSPPIAQTLGKHVLQIATTTAASSAPKCTAGPCSTSRWRPGRRRGCRPAPSCRPSIKHVLSAHIHVDVCKTCG